MTHECKWNEEKQCWRLVHPDTGDFIAEFYPVTNQLVVTKHRKTAVINLEDLKQSEWTGYNC
mgnify:CR=1 FL=1